jgi:hypothetical protein
MRAIRASNRPTGRLEAAAVHRRSGYLANIRANIVVLARSASTRNILRSCQSSFKAGSIPTRKMFGPHELTAAQASLIAAIVGSVSALVVVLIKDLILERQKEARERRRALIERKLSEIYSPLWVSFGSDDGQLGSIVADRNMRDQISARFHLLSPELHDILSRSLLVGHFENGKYLVTTSQMERLLQMSPALQKDWNPSEKLTEPT